MPCILLNSQVKNLLDQVTADSYESCSGFSKTSPEAGPANWMAPPQVGVLMISTIKHFQNVCLIHAILCTNINDLLLSCGYLNFDVDEASGQTNSTACLINDP